MSLILARAISFHSFSNLSRELLGDGADLKQPFNPRLCISFKIQCILWVKGAEDNNLMPHKSESARNENVLMFLPYLLTSFCFYAPRHSAPNLTGTYTSAQKFPNNSPKAEEYL